MPAISLIGAVLFVLQAVVGYDLYRSLPSSGISEMVIGAMITGVGITFLFVFGMVPTLALDFVFVLISTVISSQFN
ncbi:hypothetical protein SAMN04488556_0205 [Halostagnicola kamekurae]|uniref:Uncharacterized protein n=1 Tax=Halostagnicola kamekurae TaxID=619731 RepID=A0A1I6NYI1_9EURY|nr:hypothetical protein SAMN04488556_0205 [Halostagnicola kamekurae]